MSGRETSKAWSPGDRVVHLDKFAGMVCGRPNDSAVLFGEPLTWVLFDGRDSPCQVVTDALEPEHRPSDVPTTSTTTARSCVICGRDFPDAVGVIICNHDGTFAGNVFGGPIAEWRFAKPTEQASNDAPTGTLTDESLVAWASDWVHPEDQRARFAEALRNELVRRAATLDTSQLPYKDALREHLANCPGKRSNNAPTGSYISNPRMPDAAYALAKWCLEEAAQQLADDRTDETAIEMQRLAVAALAENAHRMQEAPTGVKCDACGKRVPRIKFRPLDGQGRCEECSERGVPYGHYLRTGIPDPDPNRTPEQRRVCNSLRERDGLPPLVPRTQEALPAVEAGLWRTGRTLGRTLYFNDRCVGIVDTPELAEELVRRAHPRGSVFKVGAESFFVREKDIESAKRAFEHVRAEAVHLSDNPSLVRDALKKLGKCRNCDGRGWHWPPCDRCSDSTDDHECPPRETCGECGGDGTLPIAREALSALGADRVDYPKAPTESEGPNGS